MCELCDHPDLTTDDHLELVRERLTRERFVLQSVLGSRTSPELTYSVGLTAHGLPELVVVGVRAAEARPLLRLWGDYLLDESVVLAGEALACGPWVMRRSRSTGRRSTCGWRPLSTATRCGRCSWRGATAGADGRGSPVIGRDVRTAAAG